MASQGPDSGAMLRDLTEADLEWVAAREREIFGRSAWSPSLIREDFLHGFSRWRGVERDGVLAGYAVYGYEGDAFHLMNLAIAPAARRHGLARLIMDDFLAEARRLGAPDAWLEVATTNVGALALYRSYGFEDVRVRPRYYQPEGLDALVMRRRLA
ncbi:ribosomal protein S18-alanine N-acetyltransferase [Demequina sp. NBRC 110055]|uniref:ribosomal protein S18-alanine N-acetyltransferase n=1 Tax=Demequina sp. NBRC 110055 TaxID=1570344 RepID=UPI0009FE5F51|nr:ribosomal protein S18-alanine N-acetyltransferase [Demequina sp. NBRC 110055]